jgi:hypothetical protein
MKGGDSFFVSRTCMSPDGVGAVHSRGTPIHRLPLPYPMGMTVVVLLLIVRGAGAFEKYSAI